MRTTVETVATSKRRQESPRYCLTAATSSRPEICSETLMAKLSLGDQNATVEERAHRKRRLIKGPRQFRDVRDDQPKRKADR
jgi:hypothetical protein